MTFISAFLALVSGRALALVARVLSGSLGRAGLLLGGDRGDFLGAGQRGDFVDRGLFDHAGRSLFGLDFPGEREPDYMDFAYFSFVIGMTFQVSDVVITSRTFRKLVLVHAMLSFGFNTVILALTINTVSALF